MTHIDTPCDSKSYYLKQVHQPRHLAESARLFESDYLEVRIPPRMVLITHSIIFFPAHKPCRLVYSPARMASHCSVPLPSFSLTIYRSAASFYSVSLPSYVLPSPSSCRGSHTVSRVLLHWKCSLDNVGVRATPLSIPH
jgi:hypothetical protein